MSLFVPSCPHLGKTTIVHDCLQVPSFCDESALHICDPKGHESAQIINDCAHVSGLKPPFESPHLDFPDSLLVQLAIAPAASGSTAL